MLTAVGRGIQAFATVEMVLSQVYVKLMYPAPASLSLYTLDGAVTWRRNYGLSGPLVRIALAVPH